MAVSDVVDRVRRPEYTGENRCVPCTAANVVIAALLGGAVGFLLPPAGLAVFVAGIALIYLRGYLVPGTPALTARYLPDRVLRAFDKAPESAPSPDGDFEPAAVLRWVGAIEGHDPALTAEFRDAWLERAASIREDEAERRRVAAAMVGLDPGVVTVDIDEVLDAASIRDGDERNRSFWISAAATYADLAADALLAERYDAWRDLHPGRRNAVLSGIRLGARTCPNCGGRIESFTDETISCCRDGVEVRECADCGDRLIERDPDAPEGAWRSRRSGLRHPG